LAEIALENVSKRFPDGSEAIRDLSLSIGDGELFVLLGPSGCGKSTLLNVIVGLEEASSGIIRVGNRVVNQLDPRDRDMAMVFQSYAIYPHMTVRENIAFPLRLARLPAAEIERRVEQAAQLLVLGELLDRRPANLSGGQRQRVAMGRAMVRRPAVFLMDEPLSNLDARLRVQMRAEIARLQRRLGTTMVYVTHDQTEAMTLGDRIALLKDGELQQVGTPREIYQFPSNLFVASFVGSPGMNLFPARIHEGRLLLPMMGLEIDQANRAGLPTEGEALVAGVRPEHFRALTDDAETNGENGFLAEVDLVEWLGPEAYAYVSAAGGDSALATESFGAKPEQAVPGQLVVRLEADHRIGEGRRIRLELESKYLHLFDARTGARLGGIR